MILVIAFALRAAAIVWGQSCTDNSQSDGLEAYEVAVAYELGDARATYLGQPNFRQGSKLPGPAWTIFCVLGLKSWGSIEGVSWLLVLLNVGAIGILYKLARDIFGANAALLASLLFATSSQAVRYSVPVFNPNVIPFLSTLLFLALWRVVQCERSRAIFWIAFLLFLMLQFHASALALFPAIVLLVCFSGRRPNLKWLLLGCIAGLATLGPYFFGEVTHGWSNTRAMFLPGPNAEPVHPLRSITAPISFLFYYGLPPWMNTDDELRQLYRFCFGDAGWERAWIVLSAMVVLLLISRAVLTGLRDTKGIWRAPREVFARHPGVIFCWTLIVVPTVIGLATGEPFRSRYSLILLAPLFALAGAAAADLLSVPRLSSVFAFAGGAMVLFNIYFLLSMARFEGMQLPYASRFVASFANLERVYQSLRLVAGPEREVEVNDAAFAPSPGAEVGSFYEDPKLIRRYVILREAERTRSAVLGRSETVVFELLGKWQVDRDARNVVYSNNNIVLLPSSR